MTPEEFIAALATYGFIVVGTDPEDPRIDVGISEKLYSIHGSRFRLVMNGDDVILSDANKLVAFIPFIPKIREVGDEDSLDVTALDSTVSYKRENSEPLVLADLETFSLGQVLEIFNLTNNTIQLVGGANSFLDDGFSTSTYVLGAYQSVRLSVQNLPTDERVFFVA